MILNFPPITHSHMCPTQPPISQMESNHRSLMTEFVDWFKYDRQKRAPLPQIFQPTCYVKPITSHDLEMSLPKEITSTRNSSRFQREDIASHQTQHTSRHKQHRQSRQTDMPTHDLAEACNLGSDIPIRSRNPHTHVARLSTPTARTSTGKNSIYAMMEKTYKTTLKPTKTSMRRYSLRFLLHSFQL
jgi:hypothetical protein